MAKKKRKQPSAMPSGAGDLSGSGGPESETSEEAGVKLAGSQSDEDESEVEGEFEFFDPREEDLPQVRALLFGKFGGKADGLARALVAQTRVGATVKVDGAESEAIGVTTVLNVSVHREPMKDLVGGGPSNVKSWFDRARDGREGQVGLLIFERVVNLPVNLVPWVQDAVFSEVEWAVEDEKDAGQREAFALDYLVYITDVYSESAPASRAAQSSSTKKSKKGTAQQEKDKEDVLLAFVRAEDAIYYSAAEETVTWAIEGEELRRMLMKIPYSKVPEIREETRKLMPPAVRSEE